MGTYRESITIHHTTLQTSDHTQKRDTRMAILVRWNSCCTRRTPPSLPGSSTPRSPTTATAPPPPLRNRQQRHTLLLHTAALFLYISSGICTATDSAALHNYGN